MFDSETLEVGIGMVFLFLMMSLICTGIREFIEGILKWRAMNLERAVRTLLDDRDGSLAAFFFAHPLISSLYQGGYDPSRLGGSSGEGGRLFRDAAAPAPALPAASNPPSPGSDARNMPWSARRNLPSYIPSELFAKAVIDLVARGPVDTGSSGAAQPLTMALLQERAASLASPFLRRAVQSAIDHSGGSLERMKLNLQQWFDGAMDRAAGWYKRRTQVVLFVLGLATAIVLNVDALYVLGRLTTDKLLRDTVVAAAGHMREPLPAGASDGGARAAGGLDTSGLVAARKARDELNAIGMPMGWSDIGGGDRTMIRPIQACQARNFAACDGALSPYQGFLMVVGWLITAIGVMLGAPFWFDILNKFMVIRATVKPHEKSPEEGSEDRKGAPPPRAP
ncbi:hypothetical protein [Massilia sp. METH4]|uniref:hypothetical protein n=1 Tax=Massilia sp. METH4 TaxID=3123041 RepID=UPI0030CDA344